MMRAMLRMKPLILVAAVLLTVGARAQVPATGSLLVATPELDDRNFAESVLLMIHHDDDGSLGLFVNRPTNLDPARVFPEIALLAKYEDNLFLGGPLGPRQLLLLLRAPTPGLVAGPPVLENIYVSADPGVLEAYAESRIDAARVRLYAGHAAWGPGQLETEIASGDWRVVPGRADLVFAREPLKLWQEMSRGGGGFVVDGRERRAD